EMPYKLETVSLPKHFELLIYSDGLCEMEEFTIENLIKLFAHSSSYVDFEKSLHTTLSSQEQTDDITMLHFSS
ncbi:MAG: SpoIIE family protein phosphatase, partial [Thiovulaceae bacterium]|nr:SpoIIE family protein phosphatase [Sulfurimonadaceae bacterium]